MRRIQLLFGAACTLWLSALPLRAAPDAVLQFLEDKVHQDARDFVAWNKISDYSLQRFRTTGHDRWLGKAAEAAEASLKALHTELNSAGLGARGRVEFARHQFREALATGQELQKVQPSQVGGLVLICDASFELGDYRAAEAALAEAVHHEEQLSVGSEVRSAKLELVHGRLDQTRAHLEHALGIADEQLAPPETVAWCQVQMGELAFKQGHWDEAKKWYLAAAGTLPGWYVTEEHLAELDGAQGHYDEASAAYQKLVARVPRPELFQALGDLLVFSGQPDPAKPWFDKARAAYLGSVEKGEVMYLHHGSGFFADSTGEPELALEWARRDLEGRESVYAWDTLAWAQYKAGQMSEAATSIAKALGSGAKEPHILYHAGMIRMSAGDLVGGRAALSETTAVNPRYNTFHVHR